MKEQSAGTRDSVGRDSRAMPRRSAGPFWLWTWMVLATGVPFGPVQAGAADEEAADHPLAAALELARSSRETLNEVEDFEARFAKRDVVNGRMHAHSMDMKFRTSPMSVYFRFHKPNEGREVLYVEGENDEKLLVREGGLRGLIGTLALDPNGEQALSESRYPITRSGLAKMLEAVIEQWEGETRFDDMEVKYYPNARLRGMECLAIETWHPQPRRQARFHKTRLYLDKQSNLPVRVEQYGFPSAPDQPPPLLEEYTYWNIRTNVGLTDRDFDRRNPGYGF